MVASFDDTDYLLAQNLRVARWVCFCFKLFVISFEAESYFLYEAISFAFALFNYF